MIEYLDPSSDSALVSIDQVILRRARLLLGWVTVFGQHVTSHPGQLNSAQLSLLSSARQEMAMLLCGWGPKAHSICG